MPKTLEGYVGDLAGAPLNGIAATVRNVATGATVITGASGPDGRWSFSGLATTNEYFVTLTDTAGRGVVRGPWSGEMRELWVTTRLDVVGKPAVISPDAANVLEWRANGLYTPQPTQAYSHRYFYQSSTTMADPGQGNFRSNTSPPPPSTQLAIDDRDGDNVDISALLNTLRKGDTIRAQLQTDSAIWRRVRLTADPTDMTGWHRLDIEDIGGAGTLPASGGCLLTFFLSGGAAAGDSYTKAEADARFEPIDTMYTKAESDARYPLKTDLDPYPNYLTVTEGDARYLQPATADTAYVNVAGDTMTGALTVNAATTLAGTLTQSGGFAFLGNFGMNAALPRDGTDLAIARNRSLSANEINLINTDPLATTAFVFGQKKPSGSYQELARIGADGSATLLPAAAVVGLTINYNHTGFSAINLVNASGSSPTWHLGPQGSGATVSPAGSFVLYNSTGGTVLAARPDNRVGVGQRASGATSQLDVQSTATSWSSFAAFGASGAAATALVGGFYTSAGVLLLGSVVAGPATGVSAARTKGATTGIFVPWYNVGGGLLGWMELFNTT